MPYPALQQVVVRAVEEALAEAWRRVIEQIRAGGRLQALAEAHEDVVTQPLVDELERLLDRGWGAFRRETFCAVVKSEELWNHAGTSQHRPDIIVRFHAPPREVADRRYYAVFIECKIIDKPARKTIERYCTQGVSRFTDGDYAWKMRDALMCAYVLDGSSQQQYLSSGLSQAAKGKIPVPSAGPPIPVTGTALALAELASSQ
ncbi:MAG: hypothetical protein HY901_35050, partial [Deltaproteobacteria bacterium]|nr:hypothetical protein [Deltaproteobacteria bacterium]